MQANVDHLADISGECELLLEELFAAFENAWRDTPHPPIENFLPSERELRWPALVELIYIDQELAIVSGSDAPIEKYLSSFPEIAAHSHLLPNLAIRDFGLRHRRGDHPLVDDYVARFPHLGDRFKALLENASHPRVNHAGESQFSLPSSLPDEKHPRFKNIKFHAEGGLGVVCKAHDIELDREVALKCIRLESTSESRVRRRFIHEAKLTARLNHPGVVPIHGLITDQYGQPWYVMRFVDGSTLAAAIEEYGKTTIENANDKTLAFRNLLTRFVVVCDTIAFAHSRGVVHRDLKPSNIILGEYGETVVLDWGLATFISGQQINLLATPHQNSNQDAEPLSLIGQTIGTPAFMPPEQAAGMPTMNQPSTDIYGLGAMLYNLVTGRPPFRNQNFAILRHQIVAGRYPRPREIDPRIDKALEAICLKAMATRPSERYASASELARDVERFLADEAVLAFPDPLLNCLRRWGKRHFTAITGAVVALIFSLIGLGAVAAVQTVATFNLDLANGKLIVERQRAEDNEDAAIIAMRTFQDAVVKEPLLLDSPSLEALRKRLLKEPLNFQQTLSQRLQADPKTRPQSLERLSDVMFSLARLTNEIGDKSHATDILQAALRILQKLADENASDVHLQEKLGMLRNELGRRLSEAGNSAEAIKSFESSLEIRRKLADRFPENVDYKSDQATCLNNIGNIWLRTGYYNEALHEHMIALKIRKTLVDDISAGNEVPDGLLQDLGHSYLNISSIFKNQGKFDSALQYSKSSREIRLTLVNRNPNGTEFRQDLSASENNIGAILLALNKANDALLSFTSALESRKKLAEEHPTFTQFQSDLAQTHFNIGNTQTHLGRLQDALQSYEAGRLIFKKLSDDNPTVVEYELTLASSLYNMGNILRDTGKEAKALTTHLAALAKRKAIASDGTIGSLKQVQIDLADSYNNVATLLYNSGKKSEAIDMFKQSLVINRHQSQKNPDSFSDRARLVMTLGNLVEIHSDAKRHSDARLCLIEARDLQRKELNVNPTNPSSRQSLVKTLLQLLEIARALDNQEEFAQCNAEIAKLQESAPEMIAFDARLSKILDGTEAPKDNTERVLFAKRAYEQSLFRSAVKLWSEAFAVDPKIVEDRQAQYRYDAACAASLAAAGKDKSNTSVSEAVKKELRDQAHVWLKGELTAWSKLSPAGSSQNATEITNTLTHWREDADLAAIREENELASITEPERNAWKALWAEVGRLIDNR